MNPIKQYPLRKIAENELARRLGDLDEAVRAELATSMVRQWLTNDGYAGFVLPTRQCWFLMVVTGNGLEVGFDEVEGSWGHVLSHEWRVDEEEIPQLLHRLNVCQAATCRTADGLTVRLRIEPKERKVLCQEVEEGEE